MAWKNTEKDEKTKPIKASELIEKIKSGGIEAEVNGDMVVNIGNVWRRRPRRLFLG